VNSYSCPTEIIAIFYSLSFSGAAIGGYSNIIFIIFVQTFFFNGNMMCRLSILAFMANASNSIIKLAICFLLCLNILIFHSASAVLFLLLNVVLSSLTNSSQS